MEGERGHRIKLGLRVDGDCRAQRAHGKHLRVRAAGLRAEACKARSQSSWRLGAHYSLAVAVEGDELLHAARVACGAWEGGGGQWLGREMSHRVSLSERSSFTLMPSKAGLCCPCADKHNSAR